MTADTPGHHRPTFAERLNQLFETVRPEGSKDPYGDREVARAIKRKGTDISHSYIGLLRRGEKTNPTMLLVQALADFFGVAPAYFFDDTAYQDTLRKLAELRAARELEELLADPRAALLAVKFRGLTDEGFAEALKVVEDRLSAERESATHPGRDGEPRTQ
ncbi:helix-turn-helix transcriptional regulator [Micromonospora sp. CPCC 206061]|uniref:helix-turn-helix transcriptional regulator n=1 Tax=Micromonospora sp. CPCC 206061 TaxID=3122410 RepID=UPI002FEEE7EC